MAKDTKTKQLVMLYCKGKNYPLPSPEFKFHKAGIIFPKKRLWRLDLAWEERKLALEIHGGVFIGGRHNSGVGLTKDCEKFSTLAVMGWRLIQVTTGQVKSGLLFKILDYEFGKKT